MSAPPAIKRITAEEYLALEDASTVKHELIGGQLYAMAGASFAHNKSAIDTELTAELYRTYRGVIEEL